MSAPRGRQITNFGGFLDPFATGTSSLVEAIYPAPASVSTAAGDPVVYAPVEIRELIASTWTDTLLEQVVWQTVTPDIVRGVVYSRTSLSGIVMARSSKNEVLFTRESLRNTLNTLISNLEKAEL